jgi:hypothetical protein
VNNPLEMLRLSDFRALARVRERFAEEGIDLPVDALVILDHQDLETRANWDIPLTPEQERQDSRARKIIQEVRAGFPNVVPVEVRTKPTW